MGVIGPSLEETAAAMCLHANTVKYRMDSIRAKYGIRGRVVHGTKTWQTFREAVRRGDVPLPTDRATIDGFLAYVCSRLPSGQGTPLSVAMRAWLHGEAEAFLHDREDVAA